MVVVFCFCFFVFFIYSRCHLLRCFHLGTLSFALLFSYTAVIICFAVSILRRCLSLWCFHIRILSFALVFPYTDIVFRFALFIYTAFRFIVFIYGLLFVSIFLYTVVIIRFVVSIYGRWFSLCSSLIRTLLIIVLWLCAETLKSSRPGHEAFQNIIYKNFNKVICLVISSDFRKSIWPRTF